MCASGHGRCLATWWMCRGASPISLLLTRAWKPGGRAAHHPRTLRKGGGREKHHLHRTGPGPEARRQEGERLLPNQLPLPDPRPLPPTAQEGGASALGGPSSPLGILPPCRWGSSMWTCVAPASHACSGHRAGPCISVTVAGCPCLWTRSRASPLCLWASCWRSRTRPWCGEAPERTVMSWWGRRCLPPALLASARAWRLWAAGVRVGVRVGDPAVRSRCPSSCRMGSSLTQGARHGVDVA